MCRWLLILDFVTHGLVVFAILVIAGDRFLISHFLLRIDNSTYILQIFIIIALIMVIWRK